jgi:RES domain-containing protein
MFVWRIGTDTPNYTADDLSGTGAKTTGGRWNRVGLAVLYAASSRALACLETVVHLGAKGLPLNRYLVEIDIPDSVWTAREIKTAAMLPVGWDALPAGRISLEFGDAWIKSKRTAVLEIPSVIVPEESNFLINPDHPDAGAIAAVKKRKWVYDSRLAVK